MALPSSGEISFGALADNRSSASRADIDLRGYSVTFASGSTANSRDDLNTAPHSMNEFYSADYPNSVFENVVAKVATTVVTSNGYVDGETGARIYWDITGGGTADYTAGLKYVSNNAVLLSEVNTTNDTSTTVYVTLGTIPDIAAGTNKYYPFVTTGTFTNAVGGNLTHYDQLAGGSPGLSYTSANVSAADQSVTDPTISPTVSTGTQLSGGSGYARGAITAVTAGDGGTISGSYDIEDEAQTNTVSIFNTPGILRFNITHYGQPAAGRNTTTSTQDLAISYTRAIDISKSATNINSGVSFTITAVSEGLTGAATMRVGYGTSNSNTTYTDHSDKSIGAATNYVRNSQAQAFTRSLTSGTSLETFYGKAHYTSGAETLTATSVFYVAPAFSYTATANATINVNQTQALAATSIVGNGASVSITSSPSAGSGTNSATLSPGTNNRVYTITYDGAANYSQTQDYSRTVTVNPTVSVSLSDNQSGNNYPKLDADGNTIASGTHGVSPTLFTCTPSVVGDTVTYAWTTSGFTFTSGGGSTAGQVIFKKDSAGTTSQSLTVSGNSTSATDAVSIVAQAVQKAITAGTKPATLRSGVTFSVTSIAANYTQNIKLVRDSVVIGSAASLASTMNFSIPSTNDYTNNYDSNNVATYLTDSDHTSITFNLGTTVMLPPLPVVDNFSATQDDYLKKIDLSWDTTHATTVSINQGVGSQAVDADITHSGLSNNTSYSYTLTAGNAASETVTDSDSATTINPSVSIVSEGDTSFVYGDTGNYSVTFNKNFKDAVQVHVGHGLDASQTGGTEWHIRTSEANGTTGNFSITFYPNYFAGSTFGSIVDYRVGSSDAGWFHFNQNRSFSDFSAPGVPGSLSTSASSGTAIAVTWSNPGGQTGVILYWGETSEGDFPNSTDITNGATSADATSLNPSTSYTFKIRAYITKTTTPLGGSESRTNYSAYSSTVAQSTIGWNGIVLEGDSFSGVVSGVGFATPEAAHLSDDVESDSLYYLNSTTLGTHTVMLKRAVDGSAFNGNNDWFLIGGADDPTAVAYIESDGRILAANYYTVANTLPISPTSISFSSVTHEQIAISWTDNSSIESGFKVYMNTGGAATSAHTLIATQTGTSYTKTGLSSATTYYFGVYAYRGSTLSSVLQGSQATDAGTSWGSWNATPNAEVGVGNSTRYSANYNVTVTNPDTGTNEVNATITNVSGMHGANSIYVAVGTSTNPTNYAIAEATAQTTAVGSSDVIYVRFKIVAARNDAENGTFTLTMENNGESKTTTSIAWDIEAGFGGG